MSEQNMTRRDAVKLGGVALASVGLPGGASAAGAGATAPAAPASGADYPDFRGKTVAFYTRDSKHNHHFFTDPSFTMLGGRLFVTGTIPALGIWTDGLSSAVAWDLVDSFVVYDSVEDYKVRCMAYKSDKQARAEPAAS
jgi:hypothetical protein